MQSPTYWGPPPQAPAPGVAKKSHTGLIVGIVLLILLVVSLGAVGGSYAWARGATASLEPTCQSSSDTVNWAGLTISVLTASFNPSTVLGEIQLVLGMHNPSSLTVNSPWIMQSTWGNAVMIDQESFTLPAGSTQLVLFHLSITATVAIQILTAAVNSGVSGVSTPYTFSLTRDDSALGFHFTNQLSTSGSASSSSSTSSSSGTLPSC